MSPRWTVYDIRSPWLRLPAAWGLGIVAAGLWVLLFLWTLLSEIVRSFPIAAEKTADEFSMRPVWVAMTDATRQPPPSAPTQSKET